jgi:hypothetical protein
VTREEFVEELRGCLEQAEGGPVVHAPADVVVNILNILDEVTEEPQPEERMWSCRDCFEKTRGRRPWANALDSQGMPPDYMMYTPCDRCLSLAGKKPAPEWCYVEGR